MDKGTAIWLAIVLWFAMGWYLNMRLALVHEKLDRLGEQFNGLREYLYEIDPQFDDERESERAFAEGANVFAGADDLHLKQKKRENGFRTLNSHFRDGGFRSPRDRKPHE